MTGIEFEEVIQRARRSQYKELANVLEYFAEKADGNDETLYKPFDAPTDDNEVSKRALWAFKSGRAYERDKNV